MKYLDIVIQKQLNRPLHKHMDSSYVSNIKYSDSETIESPLTQTHGLFMC